LNDDFLRPMLASLADAPLHDPQLIYEPKYDGIRAIAEIAPPRRGHAPVRLWSRLGNEKTAQFPEIVRALEHWARRLEQPVVLDGEIVALDGNGEPAGFQQLQGRIHLTSESFAHSPGSSRTAFIAFDLLREGTRDLRERPLVERRAELERVFGKTGSPTLRISDQVRGDARPLWEHALAHGWEGLIAKHADSRYKSGKRTPDWRKLKIVQEQEFVIGGWTDPRQTRSYFGALLLGYYASPQRAPSPQPPAPSPLLYAGHTGTGFNERELERLMKLLKPLETGDCPFTPRPKTNEKPHWVRPELVAEIKFTEWTADAKLRHPVYLGLRDDKKAEDVTRETKPTKVRGAAKKVRGATGEVRGAAASKVRGATGGVRGASGEVRQALIDELRALESSRRDGVVSLPDGERLKFSSLHKVFWPKAKLTKGDLLRYYVEVAPFILPAVADRPLVMKRLPNGIAGQAFYQQRAPDGPPAGVRVEKVAADTNVPARLIGGNLVTLLYMAQLAAISQDPWFSRVASIDAADHVALDLDPMPGVSFARVLDVARWIRDELAALGAPGVPKTSGADGLHIYVPLPPGTPYDAGLLFCQIIATVVAQKHPKEATIERAVAARGRRVYVDYLQNIQGKTLATAYSARASEWAGVSTPLTWKEVDAGVKREAFTIKTVPARLREVGDLWKALRTSKGVDLGRVQRYAARAKR
jgi:bifunctional non-homologous end joining protein LigD